jgi:hypothetical protein
MTQGMSPALRVLTSAHPPFDAASLWKGAIDYAYAMPRHRAAGQESPGRLLETLKARLEGEVVAFHRSLVVTPQTSDSESRRRWQIEIPLTLFPKRDEGFTRVECAIELVAERGIFFRVVDALPIDRAETMAEVGIGAELQVDASGKAGAPILLGPGTQTVASASAKVYVTRRAICGTRCGGQWSRQKSLAAPARRGASRVPAILSDSQQKDTSSLSSWKPRDRLF